jgi:RimJ/RimL family protein N-acetyltransferase
VSKDISLKTGELLLRRLSREDAEALFGYRSLPEIYCYQAFRPQSVAEAACFIDSTSGETGVPGTWCQLGIYRNDDRALIGDIGVHFLPEGETCDLELGCTVSPAYQGRGYATEALAAVIDYVFAEMDKRRIMFSVDPRNNPSRRLASRLGMRLTGYFEKSCLIRGEFCDDMVFELTPEDWANRARP